MAARFRILQDGLSRGYARWLHLRQPEVATRLREVEESQWWSRERLADTLAFEVEAAVRDASLRVPFYRDWFRQSGLDAAEFRFDRDFARLPILSKEIIQEEGERLIPEGADRSRWRRNSTGGSTGQMLAFFHDPRYEAANQADKLLTYGWCGHRPGDPWAFLWGIDRDAPRGRWQRFKNRTLVNRLWLDAFDFDRDRLLLWARELAAFRPVLLVGYASALTYLARALKEEVRIPAIQSTAETLHAPQRVLIERALGGKVFDRYGCREVGNIAQECPAHQGLHLLSRTNHVEILVGDRPARTGEIGRLVVTNLTNRAFAFMRYDTGDLAEAGPEADCPCGRGLPRIASLQGRRSDLITTPEGRLLHGEFFTHLFYGLEGVEQFQVEQTAADRLIIRLVRGPGFQEESVAGLRETIRRHGSPAWKIEFEFPAAIPVTPSGKFRYTISHLA